MRFTFKPQTALLVGGLLAATYAGAACYSQGTMTVCFSSGATVDTINFPSDTGWSDAVTADVIATSNWIYYAYGGTLVWPSTGGSGGTTFNQTGATVSICDGPAQFTDPSGHTDTLNDWRNSSCGGSLTTINSIVYGTTGGSTCN